MLAPVIACYIVIYYIINSYSFTSIYFSPHLLYGESFMQVPVNLLLLQKQYQLYTTAVDTLHLITNLIHESSTAVVYTTPLSIKCPSLMQNFYLRYSERNLHGINQQKKLSFKSELLNEWMVYNMVHLQNIAASQTRSVEARVGRLFFS